MKTLLAIVILIAAFAVGCASKPTYVVVLTPAQAKACTDLEDGEVRLGFKPEFTRQDMAAHNCPATMKAGR